MAVDAVDNGDHAAVEGAAGVEDREHRRNLERAADDGGMRGAAADLGDDADDVLLVDGGRHGRGEVMHDNDAAGRKDGEVDDLAAEELGQDAGADVGDVGGTKAEHLVVHGKEHVLEHRARLDEGLLGAGAAVDGGGDAVGHAGILGEHDVAAHDLGLVLAHGDLHAVGLGLGLGAEGVEGGLVASLLGGGVLNRVRLKRQVGLGGDNDGTDTDALGCVNSLVHFYPLSIAAGVAARHAEM